MAGGKPLRISPDVVYREIEGEAVLLDLSTGRYYGLNAVGTRVWAVLAGGASAEDVVAAITAEFDAGADEIARDVRALLDELHARRLVTTDTPLP